MSLVEMELQGSERRGAALAAPAHVRRRRGSSPSLARACWLLALCTTSLESSLASGTAGEDPSQNPLLARLEAVRADFALRADEHEPRLAIALESMRAGQSKAALGILEALSKAKLEASLAQRVQIELERARQWEEVTRAYLKDLVASGKSLRLTVEGEKLQAKVTAVEAGFVRLGANKQGRETLELSTFTPQFVLDQLKTKIADYGPSWLRLYPPALEGDAKVASLLRSDDSEEVAAIKQDAKESYRRLLLIASSARVLDELARGTWPTDAEAAGELLAVVSRMRATQATDAMFGSRKPAMTALANYVLDLRFSSEGLAGLVKGKIEALEGGRIRLTYDFAHEQQLDDFDVVDRFVLGPRTTRPPVELPAAECGFWIEDGALISLGATAARHKLQWTGPMKLEYDLVFRQHESYVTNITEFCVGFNGESNGSFVWCRNMGHLDVANRNPLWGKMCEVEGRPLPQMERRYEVLVQSDEKDAYSTYGGKEVARVPIGPRTSGFVFVWVHSSAQARLGQLVIEGRLDPDSIDQSKSEWMTSRLKELGLDA